MSHAFNDQIDNAKHVMRSAQEETSHVASHAKSTFMDGLHAVTSTIAMLKSLGIDDALGWAGLSRRRGSLAPFASFGAGCLVGVGVGMLIAPKSGVQTRRDLVRYFTGIKHDGSQALEHAEASAAKVADKAASAAKKAETKLEKGAEELKDTAKAKVESATSSAKDAVNDAKSLLSTSAGTRDHVGRSS